MIPKTKREIEKALSGKHFNLCVDLGCGEGNCGELLKRHCDYLIGVDHNLGRLSVAKEFSGYDKAVHIDIRKYNLPVNVDAVFLFDALEHLSEEDGLNLLLSLRFVPFVLLTTPSRFHSYGLRNGHLSVWTERKLQEQGFKTSTYGTVLSFIEGEKIIAIRGGGDRF